MNNAILIFAIVVLTGIYSCNNRVNNDTQSVGSIDTLKPKLDTLHFKGQIINLEQIDSNSFLSLSKDSNTEQNVDKDFNSLNVYVHDSILVLRLESGDSVKLISKPTDGEGMLIRRYIDFIPTLNSYFISNAYYEGGDCSLVNRKTGKELVVYGLPVLSPDKKWAVSSNCDVFALESPNGFQILSVSTDKLEMLWEANIEGWGPEECRWKDNATLYMRVAYIDSNNRKEKFIKLSLPDFTK